MPTKSKIPQLPSLGPGLDGPAKPKPAASSKHPKRNPVQRVPAVNPNETPKYGQPSDSKLDKAEQLCLRIHQGEDVSPFDLQSLNDDLGWNRSAVDREVRRIGNIIEIRKAAGTAEELNSVIDQMEKKQSIRDQQIPILDDQIRELMNNRDRLELDVRTLEANVKTRNDSMARLRELAPKRIKEIHAHLVGNVKSTEFNHERLTIQGQIKCIDGLDPNSDERWIIQFCQTAEGIPVNIVTGGDPNPGVARDISSKAHAEPGNQNDGPTTYSPRVHRAAWDMFVTNQKTVERPKLVMRLEKLETEFQTRKSEIDSYLDFYLP